MSLGLPPLWLPPEPEAPRPPWAFPVPPSDPTSPAYGIPPVAGLPTVAPEVPPVPPVYDAPEMLPVPELGPWDRMSAALAGVPRFTGPMPYEGKGKAFVRGLLGGVAGGISSAGAERMKRAEVQRAETNAVRKSEADRNYASAMKTWETKLTQYYKTVSDREGKVKITEQMASDLRLPAGSVGKYEDPLQLAQRFSTVQKEDRDAAAARASTVNDPALAAHMQVPVGSTHSVPEVVSARNSMRMASGGGQFGILGGTPEEIFASAQDYAQAILDGRMNPDYRSWMSMRDPRLPIVSDLLAKSGADVAQLQLSWRGENRGISAANSTPQLRMRQAAETIPLLLDELAGPPDPETGLRTGGLYAQLKNSNIQLVNIGGQMVARAIGAKASRDLARYRILARKVATEQAFLQAGGNKPEQDAINDNLAQFDVASPPEVALGGFLGADQATESFQRSIAGTGAVTPSNPYQPVPGPQNPPGGPQQRLGTNPARGTGPAVPNTMPTPATNEASVVFEFNGERRVVSDPDLIRRMRLDRRFKEVNRVEPH